MNIIYSILLKMDINQVHKINLIMLKEIDRICQKHNIKYRLDAGTFLGAVRHKGFIPWDDDCDVVFLRNEYEKFVNAIKNEKLSDGLIFVEAKENKDYFHDFTSRLFYTKEIYRIGEDYKSRFNGLYQYLWVDIFILDNLPTNKISLTILKQKIVYGLAIAHRHNATFKKNKNLLLNISVIFLKFFGKFFNLEKIYLMQEKISKEYINENNTKYVYFSNYPPIWIGYKTERKYEEEIVYVDFEDTKLPIIKKYDELLKYYYGDYMKLPEKNKQIPEHFNNIW